MDTPLAKRPGPNELGGRLPELCALMERLLADDGCPWDRAQSLETLKPYLIEEAYEVLEAMDAVGREHCEELGDLLFQIVFHAALRMRMGEFDVDDVIGAIVDKMRRRHPHVFEGTEAGSLTDLHARWVSAKALERKEKGEVAPSAIDGVPVAAPALLRAWRITEKASRIGFDWPNAMAVRDKVAEELAELDAALAGGSKDEVKEELGDLLFTLVNLGRKIDLDPEEALRASTRKFEARFRAVELKMRHEGKEVSACTLDELETAWQEVKRLS